MNGYMRVSGHGTVNHPVTGAPMRTTVFEIEGIGRVGEWLDYGEDEAATVRALAATLGKFLARRGHKAR